MATAKGKKRYNLHLHAQNTDTVRKFLELDNNSLSNYIDMFLALVVTNIINGDLKKIKTSQDLKEFFKILKIQEYHSKPENTDMNELMEINPKHVRELVDHYSKLKAKGFQDKLDIIEEKLNNIK